MTKNEEPDPGEIPDPEEMGTWVNQRRHEPLPASHHDEPGQAAVTRNEEHKAAHAAGRPGQRPSPGVQPAQPSAHEPEQTGPGKAVRDMMPGGPAPQCAVPDAPAVQVAAAEVPDENSAGEHSEKPGPVRLVSNAVPGKPDGEVDTRP